MTTGAWVVVVEPTEPAIAERAFARWRRDNPLWSAQLSDADILVDTICRRQGKTLRRYRVKRIAPTYDGPP
jgi:hypothetical protein